jgi:predicted permease
MRKLRALAHRLLGLFRSRPAEADFSAELESNIALHTDDLIRSGLTPTEARRQALIRLGGAEQTRQAHRERSTLPWLETLIQDLRFGLRVLGRNPGYTVVCVLTLALGIGANSAVFTVARAALLRSWPAKEPNRLVELISTTPQGSDYNFSYPDYQDLSAQSTTLDGILACSRHAKAVRVGSETIMVLDDIVSSNYFSVLGIPMQFGRTFSLGSTPTSASEVVISDTLWHRSFSADPSLVGKQVVLSGSSYTVLGIAPPGFRGLQRGIPTDLWIPVTTEYGSKERSQRDVREFEVLGRLRPGVTEAAARAELDTLGRHLAIANPAIDKARNISFISESERLRQAMIPTLILMTAVGLVLLICCANVAGLVLARAEARSKEVAMRIALGAGRLRLVRQLLTESLLLATAGAAAGLIVAAGILRLQPALLPPAGVELGLDLHLDASVIAFTLGVTLAALFAFGLVPAIQASRASFIPALSGQNQAPGRTVRRFTLRNALVLGEIALSMTLLSASALLARSLLISNSIPLGFDRQKSLVFFDLLPGLAGYDAQQSAHLFDQLEDRIAAMPGVHHATVARRMLLSDSGGGVQLQVSIPGVQLPQSQLSVPIKFNAVGRNYFQTMGTRLLQGRAFTSADNPSTGSVAVISRAMAERFWPGQEPLGRQILFNGKPSQIVGIAENAKINSVHETPEPYMYLPIAQMPGGEATLIVDAGGDAQSQITAIRAEIQRIDRTVPLNVRTLNYLMQQVFWADRIAAGFVAFLGVLGVLLGAVGLYGIVAFVVHRRSSEIGVRMALGAERGDILRMVLRQGLILAAIGTGAGLLLSLAVMHLLSSLLYGVQANDPLSFACSAIVVILVAAVATWIPARRAASIDPMQALRSE